MPVAGSQGGGFMNVASEEPGAQSEPMYGDQVAYHERMQALKNAGKLPLIQTGNPKEGPHRPWGRSDAIDPATLGAASGLQFPEFTAPIPDRAAIAKRLQSGNVSVFDQGLEDRATNAMNRAGVV